MTFNDEFTLIYSKSNIDALPVTSTPVTKAPCLDPTRSADFIDKPNTPEYLEAIVAAAGDQSKEFYPLELDRSNFLRDEPNVIKKKCLNDEHDPRYTKL